jgi:sodium-dependent dicarboxylate transporter 2/3/5
VTTGAAPLSSGPVQRLGSASLLAGLLPLLAVLVLPPPADMGLEAWRTLGVAGLMAVWWVTEALPLPATALLPLVLLPPLGLASIGDTASPYANPVIFLFLGGFVLAAALTRSGLQRRIALAIVAMVGSGPGGLLAGFMVATAFLSMWVSNTATTLMMLPIALSVVALGRHGGPGEGPEDAAPAHEAAVDAPPPDAGAPEPSPFATVLLLGIAYAASIGGMATLIGTPPNALLAGFLDQTYGIRLGFLEWSMIGLPVSAVGLAVAWLVLARRLDVVPPGLEALSHSRAALGPWRDPERAVAAVTAATAVAWVCRPLLERWIPGLSDAGIAITASLVLFIASAARPSRAALLTWDDVEGLPWGVLLLIGGGLSLASVIQQSGLAGWIGGALGAVSPWPTFLVVGAVAATIVVLTELASNTATAATFLPVGAAVGIGAGLGPFSLTAAVALSASAAFMMPVATAPNAVVYGSGLVPMRAMVRAGVWLNLAFIVLVTVAVRLLAPLVAWG